MSYEKVHYSKIESEVNHKGETLLIQWGASLLYERDHGTWIDPPNAYLVNQDVWVDKIYDGEGDEIKPIDAELMAFALAWIEDKGIIGYEHMAKAE